MTNLRLITEPATTCLDDYARVPIAFDVTERLALPHGDRVPVVPPYLKDYDAQPGQHPRDWPRRWDVTTWWFAAAFIRERRVGGAAVIIDARDVEPALATPDAALLWDIRVDPAFRRRGVGRALLAFAESHARAAGRRRMTVETQDVNFPACRFYAHAGYVLTDVNPRAYAALPEEAQLIWRKDLTASA